METRRIDNLTYSLKRSNRKSIGITIERDGSVVVRAPFDKGFSKIEKFVSEKRIWIHKKLAQKQAVNREKPKHEFINGQGFLYLGKSYRLRLIDSEDRADSRRTSNGLALRLRHGYFELAGGEKRNARRYFVSWYKKKTEQKLKERIPRYDKRIGVTVSKCRVAELGHRWASHSRNGSINVNWRSVMAPIWVFDYILVHEMVHIIEHPHSTKFWRIVSRVIPDHEEHVRWLNENGANLDL